MASGAAASFSRSFCVCFLITSRRMRSLRRVSTKCAHAVRAACHRAWVMAPMRASISANENWVERITDTNSAVATTM